MSQAYKIFISPSVLRMTFYVQFHDLITFY
jgi:hypothetical protein